MAAAKLLSPSLYISSVAITLLPILDTDMDNNTPLRIFNDTDTNADTGLKIFIQIQISDAL